MERVEVGPLPPGAVLIDDFYRRADTNPMRLWMVCKICGSMVDVSMRGEHWQALHAAD